MGIVLFDMLRRLKKYCFRFFHPVIGEVWQLHRVTDEVSVDPTQRDYEITPGRLVSLIGEYLQKDYHFISVDQLYAMLQSNQYDRKFVVVTLDDGYADNYEIAYPIFKQYGIPFCIFVTKDFIFKGKDAYRFLSERQIVELCQEPLCTIGCHTVSHPHLNLLVEERQYSEIKQCKDWLEQLVGLPVKYFAYPYGAYSFATEKIVRHMGLTMAFAAWGGEIRKNVKYNLYAVPREIVK